MVTPDTVAKVKSIKKRFREGIELLKKGNELAEEHLLDVLEDAINFGIQFLPSGPPKVTKVIPYEALAPEPKPQETQPPPESTGRVEVEDIEDIDMFETENLGGKEKVRNRELLRKDPIFKRDGSIPMMGFTSLMEDDGGINEMTKKETDFKPGNDYLERLRSGGFDLRVRNEAMDWISKVCVHHRFGPLCIYLSMSYFDRFLTYSELPKDKAWAVQLLAVSCLSLAAKMVESHVPNSVNLQVENPMFVFDAKAINKMRHLVLNALNRRLQVITPFSFIHFYFGKINDHHPSQNHVSRSSQLILHSCKEVEYFDFKSSEIAAAAALAISFPEEAEAGQSERVLSSLIHVKKESVARCLKMMRDLSDKIGEGQKWSVTTDNSNSNQR